MGFSSKDLRQAGWKPCPAFEVALEAARKAVKEKELGSKKEARGLLQQVWASPQAYVEHAVFGEAAEQLVKDRDRSGAVPLRDTPVEYTVWGRDWMDDATLKQMETAARLPVSVRGAQMPDGHLGYGLPIGGVLATRNVVIPYAVGVDIACRVKLSVLPIEAAKLDNMRKDLVRALTEETAFGIGAKFPRGGQRYHEVLDDPAWEELPQELKGLTSKAREQLGSSGSGNHFVEWGEFVLEHPDLGLEPGRYLALFSHSGSRGFGAAVADYFTKVAQRKTWLPESARHLAWLELDTPEGQAYWNAMNLAGRYAHANHECIHNEVLKHLRVKPILEVENHHNFAWKEEHFGEEVIVHRKGATPAAAGELGMIPGTMADAGYLVRGKGNPESLNSAAHGAGRRMSRKKAKADLSKQQMREYLERRGVQLLSAGLDEAPMAYKNIRNVMDAQSDLVEIVAHFQPRIVRMAEGGPAED